MGVVRQVNETIGRIKCPISGDWAEVRRDKKGRFYYVGTAGMIKPNLERGQDWILQNSEMFGKDELKEINSVEPKFGRRIDNGDSDDNDGWGIL